MKFKLHSKFEPAGGQPKAIKKLVKKLQGAGKQTLLGITGSGNYSGFLSGYTKTFENTFNLKTGVYNEETTVDHKANGLTSGSPVVLAYRSSGHTDETPYSINSEIVFSPSFDNLEMEVEFLASGVNNLEPTADTTRSVLITGKL